MAPGLSIDQAYEKVEVGLIDLETGTLVEDGSAPESYDIARAGKDPKLSTAIPRADDRAQIKRKPKYMPVYRVLGDDGKLRTLILPVHGYGLWSTLYGFLALEGDLRTVQGLKFYQHAETPGLGGEVDNPKWRALWQGKVVFDEQWRAKVELVKGSVDSSTPDAQHKVDGLAGATLTSRGVTNLLNFWLGEEGYAPYLARLRDERS
jgi:Na+-transporting NADH:ubiquinone oxidoreductase subunit C